MNLETKQREQRNDALIIANKVRTRRASEKARIRMLPYGQACSQLRELVIDPPDWIASASLTDALQWLPHYGRVKANETAFRIGVRDVRTLRQLTPRQREQLAGMLAGQVQNSGNEGGKAA